MPAIQRSAPHHPAPIEVLKDAIAEAREHDITVRIGAPGVAAASTYGPRHWELDPLASEPAVDPIGAVLLSLQPPAIDPYDAARLALDVPRAWIDGIALGMLLEPHDPAWMATRQRDLFLHGYESGVCLRIHVMSSARETP